MWCLWAARNPKYCHVMGGKINKSAAIQTIKRILKNIKMIIIIKFRFSVDGWGGQQTRVRRQAEDVFSFLNSFWLTAAAYSRFSQGSICMKFLHHGQLFLSSPACVPVAFWRRGKSCCLGFGAGDKHLPGSLYTAEGFLAGAQARRCRDTLPSLWASAARVTSQ